jgi:hypothetical protein
MVTVPSFITMSSKKNRNKLVTGMKGDTKLSRSPKRARRPPAAHLLVLECEAEKLANQRLDIGSKASTLLQSLFPEKKIVLVKTSSVDDLGRSLAEALNSHKRFRTILVVGHSNEQGLKLTAESGFKWGAIARWLSPFNPEFLLLAACHAGKFRATQELFAEIKSLREIYASPVKLFRDQSDPLVGLLIALLKNRKVGEKYFRLLQAAGYTISDGLLYRWKRGEVVRMDEIAGVAWNILGDLLNKRI